MVEAEETPVPSTPAAHHEGAAPARALAKPPVRKLAKDLGVDLLSLTPSGPQGTVTREDVQAAAAELSGAQRAPAPSRLTGRRGSGRPASRSRACAR